ncbi:hypothetical protein O6H91_11G054500 [Diphasiastrum complanatum]|uniref:Uncharacterized protein n=1 Tax=Diphasiastrum complanatum TaxID=34168 RepID=A0ACC2C9G4_DIPCM|nr:hypothetical protein O6H91_11G054500 [Diphasiastrum complanatum]
MFLPTWLLASVCCVMVFTSYVLARPFATLVSPYVFHRFNASLVINPPIVLVGGLLCQFLWGVFYSCFSFDASWCSCCSWCASGFCLCQFVVAACLFLAKFSLIFAFLISSVSCLYFWFVLCLPSVISIMLSVCSFWLFICYLSLVPIACFFLGVQQCALLPLISLVLSSFVVCFWPEISPQFRLFCLAVTDWLGFLFWFLVP